MAALMTLCEGIVTGALFALAATLPFIASFISTTHHLTTPSSVLVVVSMLTIILSNGLTWLFAVLLRKGLIWSKLLQQVALGSVLVISLIHLAYPDMSDWWATQLQLFYKQATAVTNALVNHVNTNTPLATIDDMVNAIKPYTTGLLAIFILLSAFLQLIVACWWLSAVFKPGSLRNMLSQIRLSRLAGLLFLACLILAYLGNSVVLDIMPILYVLFAAAGLSLLHYLLNLYPHGKVWFFVFYGVLLLAIVTMTIQPAIAAIVISLAVVLLATLALLDIGWDVRKRIKKVK
jgi:hypothetical protein